MATLIVYGKAPLTSTFHSGITGKNRKSFEKHLVPELEKLALRNFTPATSTPICQPSEIGALLKSGSYDSVVFYGHAFMFTIEDRAGRRNEMRLQTACGRFITPSDFVDEIRGTKVKTVLIAGCASNAFAADMSTQLDKVRIGGIQSSRTDEIGGDENSVTHFLIIPQAVKWWGK
jgi:hypothetical protein